MRKKGQRSVTRGRVGWTEGGGGWKEKRVEGSLHYWEGKTNIGQRRKGAY